MKRLLFLLMLVITLVSCNSESGKLVPSKVETAIQNKKLVKFRAKEIWFSNISFTYVASHEVILLELDTLYKIGDTVKIKDEDGFPSLYALVK